MAPGYYTLSGRSFAARMIVEPNTRWVSLDVWHASQYDEGTVAHVHYDLIGTSAAAHFGEFAIAQDGLDCGHVTIAPATENGRIIQGVITATTGGLRMPFGGPATNPSTDYADLDHANGAQVAVNVGVTPDLYNTTSDAERYIIGALSPACDP